MVIRNDPVLHIELDSAAQVNMPTSGVWDNPTMALILDKHLQRMKRPGPCSSESQDVMVSELGKLEEDAFAVAMKESLGVRFCRVVWQVGFKG